MCGNACGGLGSVELILIREHSLEESFEAQANNIESGIFIHCVCKYTVPAEIL